MYIVCLSARNDLQTAIENLQNGNREARKTAAMRLGRIRDVKSIPFLLKAIHEDSYSLTRVFAIQSLTWIADRSVIKDLISIIRGDQDELVRLTAIEAIISFKATEALNLLYELSYDLRTPEKIRTEASKAIGAIEGYSPIN